jgi:riboflavin synthase
MFTGLVEDIGTIVRADRRREALVLGIRTQALPVAELRLGDSVAIDGVCLTVTETAAAASTFTVLAGGETLGRTTIGSLHLQSRVNLERALAAGDRLGGHLVAGHVDGIGSITSRRDLGANIDIQVGATGALLRYVVEKGSIAIDGISLTVNRVGADHVAVALIPHTVGKTTLAGKVVGNKVNLEVDIIGKYVEKLLGGYKP